MNHAELVLAAARWLRRRCSIVATEVVSGSETADAIGWDSRGQSILIECKTSRSDFLADSKKYFRRYPVMGMGSTRYYMAPKGLLKFEDMPDGWSLLEVDDKGFVWTSPVRLASASNARAEIITLVSILRRLPERVEGVSIRFYTDKGTKSIATVAVLTEEVPNEPQTSPHLHRGGESEPEMNHAQEQRFFDNHHAFREVLEKAEAVIRNDMRRLPDREHYGSDDIQVGNWIVSIRVINRKEDK